MDYSIIIPVYNRPEEVHELLDSLVHQEFKNFEVIIVEDGSSKTSEHIVQSFRDQLNISYYYKQNSGPGPARNYGFEHAKGDYFIILDSDCTVPSNYLKTVDQYVSDRNLDAFGGPDRTHDSFTPIQKAISYSMTSFLTTGGIRGRRKHIGPFHPRSFNMGISRKVFEKTQGFSNLRYGEDIEFSIRMIKSGFKTGLIAAAFVYHKRRQNFLRFFRQIFYSGSARIDIYKIYPDELRIVHLFPALFTLYCLLTSIMFFVNLEVFYVSGFILSLYMIPIFIDSVIQNRSLKIGLLAIISSFVQLIGYGTGFMRAYWKKANLPQRLRP